MTIVLVKQVFQNLKVKSLDFKLNLEMQVVESMNMNDDRITTVQKDQTILILVIEIKREMNQDMFLAHNPMFRPMGKISVNMLSVILAKLDLYKAELEDKISRVITQQYNKINFLET